jgi:hypothetical protein
MRIPEMKHLYNVSKDSIFLHSLLVLVFFVGFYSLWFSPILLRDQLLAPWDGYLQSLPAYYATRTLWSTQILGGFPVAADVTPQTWYPVSLLLSLLPHSWNIFVISAYVLASVFSYAYIHVITKSVLAGLVTGITYGASGFMMGYISEPSMTHTAAWVPFTLLACEQLLRSGRKIWLVLLSIGVACVCLAGHPQLSIYGLTLLSVYAIFLGNSKTNQCSFYGQFTIAICIGLGLAAIQLLPTAELIPLTPRSTMSFNTFVAVSMPLSHAVRLVFPYILGVLWGNGFVPPYWGNSFVPHALGLPYEAHNYTGILPLILATLGLSSRDYSKSFRYFWVVILVISFLITLGEATPFAWITYQIPVYNKFQIMTRHSMELTISVSILAGLGISVIENSNYGLKNLKKLFRFNLVLIVILLLWAIILCLYSLQKQNSPELSEKALFFLSIGILPSLVIVILGWISLNYYVKKRSQWGTIALLMVLIVDFASLNSFNAWPESPVSGEILSPPLFLQKYQMKLKQEYQRFLPIRGGFSSADEAPPNFSRLWNAPSMSGYGPLLLSRVSEFMALSPGGSLVSDASLLDSKNLSFDLAAVRYITSPPPSEVIAPPSDDETKWSSARNLVLPLGRTCIPEPREEIAIDLPGAMEIDSIHLVGTLGCSVTIPQGTNVLEVKTIDLDGNSKSYFLKAGKDLSEFAINQPDVSHQIKHQAAKIFKQTPIPSGSWLTNLYVTKVILTKPSTIRQLRLILPAENTGVVMIDKISLNNSRAKTSYPLLGSRWKYVEDLGENQIRQNFYPFPFMTPVLPSWLSRHVQLIQPTLNSAAKTQIYENRNVFPRAWLTSQVQVAQPDQILTAVKTSKLPNGSVFEPLKTALIEESIEFPNQIPDSNATVQVEFPSETQVRLQTKSTQPSFLVLSDVFYPGWQAHIDGKPVHIFQTNYIFRGVQLPAGEHTVTFSFRPLSFAIGCGISAASFALLLYFVATDCKPKPQAPSILPS